MSALAFSTGAYNPRTNIATGLRSIIVRKKLHSRTSAALKSLIKRSTTASVSISRREAAVGLGFSFSFLQFLNPQHYSAAAIESTSPPCEFTAASSGLEYCDKVIGTGPEPVKGQLIKAHYVGKLENGKVFDSSYDRGKPLTFRVGVGEVIKGWDEGILGGDGIPAMSAGGKRKLRIPPALGYGIRGAGCRGGSCIIPPDSVLLFDVEFVGKA
ncbi:FKBP-type peptidyl-prolyl cis-trans isomerase 3 family protein [Dorcoceras hygrometricum]|uniref:peptidylprolyl isomerase n=1 Tax=Dorcoceras hygrometricum TaxID=472368 RepID=A0A2Z7BAY0_9LAMI|nr:FKBP-type peptidyl-prolyl cis-trans isomerase 3 family protein [Dorcoceras hygrometricum]